MYTETKYAGEFAVGAQNGPPVACSISPGQRGSSLNANQCIFPVLRAHLGLKNVHRHSGCRRGKQAAVDANGRLQGKYDSVSVPGLFPAHLGSKNVHRHRGCRRVCNRC